MGDVLTCHRYGQPAKDTATEAWKSPWLKHDDVIKWKHFLCYWPFVRGIRWSPVNSPHKGQWRGALMFSLICVWINGSINNREAGDLRRYRAHYDVIVMKKSSFCHLSKDWGSYIHCFCCPITWMLIPWILVLSRQLQKWNGFCLPW